MIQQFDNRFFYYRIRIIDSSGNEKTLTNSSIGTLVISDSILSPFKTGSMTITNISNALEADFKGSVPALQFSGDNRDVLTVDIIPNVTGNLKQDIENKDIIDAFGINHIFAINELVDPDDVVSSVVNIMNLREIYHQYLLDSSSLTSSTDIVYEQNESIRAFSPSDLNNSQRAAFTGDLLKGTLKRTLGLSDSNFGSEFDRGCTRMFFQPTVGVKAFDDVMMIAHRHLGEINRDPCILTFNNDKFTFMPYSKLYQLQLSEPETYVIDNFVITGGQQGSDNAKYAGTAGLSYESPIIEYKNVATSGDVISQQIRNLIISSAAPSDNNHIIQSKTTTYSELKNYFNPLFVDPFRSLHPQPISAAIDFDQLERNDRSRPRLTSISKPRNNKDVVRNIALLNMFTSSESIVFRCIGSTHRKSGKFIDITVTSSLSDTSMSNNIVGRWLITKVTHVFYGSQYYNVIEASKTYNITK